MDPDLRKEIEVDPDPDLDPERGLKWIRIRPNAVDPGGSGSETLLTMDESYAGYSQIHVYESGILAHLALLTPRSTGFRCIRISLSRV